MKKFAYWLPALVWMVIIFGFSSQPSLHVAPASWVDFLLHKLAHLFEYFTLFSLYCVGLRHTTKLSPFHVCFLALCMAVIYAGTDEFHQLFIPTRDGKLRDVIIDALGASLGWVSIKHRSPDHLKW